MNNRSSLGFEDDEPEVTPASKPASALDLSDFHPTPAKRPDKDKLALAAEKSAFKSREPRPTSLPPPSGAVKQRVRRRTGRTAQINLKAKPEIIEQFYKFADDNEMSYAVAFEKAVNLLLNEYK